MASAAAMAEAMAVAEAEARAGPEADPDPEPVMLMSRMTKPVDGKHFKRVIGVPTKMADWCQRKIFS